MGPTTPKIAEQLSESSLGLTSEEVFARLALSGPNQVSRPQRRLHIFQDLLWQPLVLLLVLVGVIYAALGRFRDATVILIVIVAVIGVEAAIRWRAGKALSTLSKLSAARALVWRDGELQEVEPEGLVRDDIILLSAGSRVPADAQLIQSSTFLVDESLVSGESQPVEHGLGFGLDPNLHAGSHVVRGQGVAVITATGKESALGRVAALVERSQPPPSPLQQQMERLSRALIALSVASSVVVALIGFIHGLPGQEMLIDGLTLAFASIPAELPVLVVVVLGFGCLYLSKRGAVVRNLRAAETLGAMTLLCTDKTGTLTRNRIALTETITAAKIMGLPNDPGDPEYVRKVARLACDPPTGDDPRSTDPIDLAIWRTSRPDWPEASVRFAFDEGRRLASGLSEIGGQMVLGVKGAAEAVIVRSVSWRSSQGVRELDEDRKSHVLAVARDLASSGGRVLAVASRGISGPLEGGPTWLEKELVLEGFLVCSDALRAEVPGAIRELFQGGVTVCMVTGDQQATAEYIGRAAGLSGPVFIAAQTKRWDDHDLAARAALGSIFARSRPEDKLRVVQAATGVGEVVGVTGDGVNDAPALEAAAIGVAMGESGSDVAREAADLILTKDSFETLTMAVNEGRRLYDNVRKAVRYYLGVKLALILASLGVAIIGYPLPFAPLQILVIEFFLDIGASLGFINQPSEADDLQRRPRTLYHGAVGRSLFLGVVAGGLTLAAIAGGLYILSLSSLGVGGARTLALASWLAGQASLGVVMGSERRAVTLARVVENRILLVWVSTALIGCLAVLVIPPLQDLLSSGPVSQEWAILGIAASLIAPWWLEVTKWVRRSRRQRLRTPRN